MFRHRFWSWLVFRIGQVNGFKLRKGAKFGNKKVVVDGRSYDSKREAARGQMLILAEKAGEISGLEFQKVFRFEVNGKLICKYIADFSYQRNEMAVVEDCKAPFLRKNPAYRIKNKLMAALYGIDILES